MIRRVVVGLSGGVDSSVAAYLLQRRGFEVVGVFMRNWDAADEAGAGLPLRPCPADGDLASAAAVAAHLRIPLTLADFSRQYWGGVFEAWVAGYRSGLTPNPDVACNRLVKFGAFREHALGALQGDAFATGHYAQLWPDLGRAPGAAAAAAAAATLPRLYSAVDARKDQSDFLATVPGAALQRAIFPLGGHTKAQVRALARAAGLPSAARRDSMGICFVGKRALGPFLAQYLTPTPARAACLATGRQLTPRPQPAIACAEALTCGQRLGLGGLPEPYYCVGNGVLGRAAAAATAAGSGGSSSSSSSAVVWAVPGRHHPALYATAAAVDLKEFHAVSGDLAPPLALAAQAARQRGAAAAAAWAAQALLPWLRAEACSEVPQVQVLFRERHSVQGSPAGQLESGGGGEGAGAEAMAAAPGAVTVARASEFFAACWHLHTRSPTAAEAPLEPFVPSWRAMEQQQQQQQQQGGAAWEEPLLLLLRPTSPVRAATPGQVLVLYSAQQGVSLHQQQQQQQQQHSAQQVAEWGSVATAPVPLEGVVAGAEAGAVGVGASGHGGRLVYGGGSIYCTGPSLFDQCRALV